MPAPPWFKYPAPLNPSSRRPKPPHLPLPPPPLPGLGMPSAARSLRSISASLAARSSGVSNLPCGGPSHPGGGGPPLLLRPSLSNTERGPARGGGSIGGPRGRGGLGQSRAMWPSWPHLKHAPGPPGAPGLPGGGPEGSHLGEQQQQVW
jgi:hypothetical protein